jgi:hypothetical protein
MVYRQSFAASKKNKSLFQQHSKKKERDPSLQELSLFFFLFWIFSFLDFSFFLSFDKVFMKAILNQNHFNSSGSTITYY